MNEKDDSPFGWKVFEESWELSPLERPSSLLMSNWLSRFILLRNNEFFDDNDFDLDEIDFDDNFDDFDKFNESNGSSLIDLVNKGLSKVFNPFDRSVCALLNRKISLNKSINQMVVE